MKALELKGDHTSLVFHPTENGINIRIDAKFEGGEFTDNLPLTKEEYLTLANAILATCFSEQEHKAVMKILDKDGK